jgi:hypothetical protein
MGIYIQYTALQTDPALVSPLSDSSTIWTPAAIEGSITEAETYIESYVMRLGYTRAQLLTAPSTPAPLMLQLITTYCRYVILRDIYTNASPQKGGTEPYTKWLDTVTDMLAKIQKNFLRFLDTNGVPIDPSSVDSRYAVGTTTPTAARIFTLDHPDSWYNDPSNSSSDVVGNKPAGAH